MSIRRPLTILLLASMAAGSLAAQRVTLDLRASGATPLKNFASTDLGNGIGFGATVAFRLQPHLHVVAGWDWMHFGSDEATDIADSDFEETGYTLGLRFEHPFREASRLMYRLEAGGTYKHIDVENADGDLVADSKHGGGFEFGAGVLVPMKRWHLAPALRYRMLSREFEVGRAQIKGDLSYLALEIGFSRKF
jgi:hypothetical protein